MFSVCSEDLYNVSRILLFSMLFLCLTVVALVMFLLLLRTVQAVVVILHRQNILRSDRFSSKNLRKHGPPDSIMVFRDTEGLVYETLDRAEQSNIPRVLGYNYMFTKA